VKISRPEPTGSGFFIARLAPRSSAVLSDPGLDLILQRLCKARIQLTHEFRRTFDAQHGKSLLLKAWFCQVVVGLLPALMKIAKQQANILTGRDLRIQEHLLHEQVFVSRGSAVETHLLFKELSGPMKNAIVGS
jgi:hypothetical protein